MPQGQGTLVTIAQYVKTTAQGSIVTIDQTVAIVGQGSIVTIDQDVRLRLVGSGTLVTIGQQTKNTGAGTLVTIDQRVRSGSTSTSNAIKYGWDADLYIDNIKVQPWHIHGKISITRTENNAALMNVTIINQTGALDIASFHGKSIFLNIEKNGKITRVYTGTVDIPEFDILNKLITLRCTDKRTEQINSQLGSQLKFIGEWSPAIFEEPDDVADELSQRLQTTTKTVDFDAYGQFTISDFLPKSIPDFTLTDSDIYRRNPSVQVASRGRLVNRVKIEFDYRYVRLRQRERQFELYGPSFCDVSTTPGLQFMTVKGIESNINSFAWDVKPGSISYTYLPGKGWQTCGGKKFLWNPVATYGETKTKKDSNGNIITDENGNQVTETSITKIVDYTKSYATAATWTAAKRFAQDVNQTLNITIDAPQSQSQYGIIERKQRHGLDVKYDAFDFENGKGYKAPDGFTASAGDYYLDKNGEVADFNNAIKTAVSIAKTSIIKSHRDNYVSVDTPIWPEIDLKHTVHVNATTINAIGKVSSIIHNIDITSRDAFTTVTISMSKSVGTQTDDAINIQRTVPPLIGEKNQGALKMYTQKDYKPGANNLPVTFNPDGSMTTATIAKEPGMVAPAIDDESRNAQKETVDYQFNVAIPNNTLDVIY